MRERKDVVVHGAVTGDTVIMDKSTGKKLILLSLTSTDDDDYFIGADKNGEIWTGNLNCIKVF